MMRTLLISTVSSIALATAAFAADLPNTKGPAPFLPPPPPVFSWTGIYVGVNAGLSAGNFGDDGYESDEGGYPYYQVTGSARSSGFSGGGQIGFNYQFANNLVVGLEADFQGSTLKGTYINETNGDPSDIEQAGSKVDWWGTARGRIGYAFGNILPYVTGGFAYGHVSNFYNDGDPSDSYSIGGTHGGWTAGAGLEYALTHNLTVKVEYLYTDLGSWTSTEPGGDFDVTYSDRVRTQFSTVRAGLNYKFDWLAPAGPVVAKY